MGSAWTDETEEGASSAWHGITQRQLIRFEPPLLARAAPVAVQVHGYLELPHGAPLEISHLQMNQEKNLCYWGSHKAGPTPSAPGWISSSDIVFS